MTETLTTSFGKKSPFSFISLALKFERFKFFNDEHPLNIPVTLCTLFTPSATFSKEEHFPNKSFKEVISII